MPLWVSGPPLDCRANLPCNQFGTSTARGARIWLAPLWPRHPAAWRRNSSGAPCSWGGGAIPPRPAWPIARQVDRDRQRPRSRPAGGTCGSYWMETARRAGARVALRQR